MDPESVDLFELHNLLRAECGTMDLLAPLGLSPAAIKALLSLSVSHTQALTEYRLDMETGKTSMSRAAAKNEFSPTAVWYLHCPISVHRPDLVGQQP